MPPSRRFLRELAFWFLAAFLTTQAAFPQQPSQGKPYIPIEVQPADSEIKALLESARTDSDLGNYEIAFSKTKRALELAQTKGFVRDKAIVEEAVALGYFVLGQLDESFKFYQSSFQDAVDSSNLVLQADVLVSLAMLPQLQGKSQAASDLLIKAQKVADESKNPYVRSRVLGELGRLRIVSGNNEGGLKALEEALSIDRVNSYDFEPLHLVYEAYATLSQQKPDFPKAISQFESARDSAVEKRNYIAFVLAQNALGAIYPNNGEPQKGIAMLEATLNGNVLKDGQTSALPETFRAAATLPFMKAVLLEGLGKAYQQGQQLEKALEVWIQLYSLSVNVDLKLTQAESARAIAEIYKVKQDLPNAVKYFSIASQDWRALQNDQELSQALISEALFVIQSGKGEQAIPLENEVGEIAGKDQNRGLVFSANMVLGEIYQPLNKFDEARTVLEKAQSLIKPGPDDSEIDNKFVVETYERLADVYKVLGLPIKELVAIEKAIAVLQVLKDDEHLPQELSYMRGRLEALHVQDAAKQAAADGRLVESLWYSEIVFVWTGAPKGDVKDENWNRVLSLPFQIVQQPTGPQALDEIFSEMGSLINIARLDILNALSDHFIRSDLKPALAERYATEAEEIVKQSPNPANILLVTPVCELTIAYAWENKGELARQKASECVTLADEFTDPTIKNLANLANAAAQVVSNNQGDAVGSLEFFLQNRPADPELHLNLAFAFLKQGLYDRGIEEFRQTIKLMQDKNDINAEANAFARMASVLAALNSKEAKLQQLEYWKSAERLYKQANNTNLVATVEMQVGMYYVNAGDSKSALTYFQQAQALGQDLHTQVSADAAADIGIAYVGLRDYQRAIDSERKAAALYQQLGNKSQEAMALEFLAEDLQSEGNLDDALRACLAAEALARESASTPAEYQASRTLGTIYTKQGEFDKASRALTEAVEKAKQNGQQQNEASTEILLAGAYEVLGQWEDALAAVLKSMEIFKSIGDHHGQAAANVELADLYSERASSIKDFDKAMNYYRAAKELGFSSNIDILEIYLQTGRYVEGIAAANELLTACQKTKDSDCQAHALISRSEFERKAGNLKASASSLQKAGPLVARSKDFYLHGRLLYGEAGQNRAEGHLDQALELYERLIKLLEEVKGEGGQTTERTIAEAYGFIYDELTSTLFEMSTKRSDPDRSRLASLALQYVEMNKAREFADSWGRTFVTELRLQLPSEVQEIERTLLAKSASTSSKQEWDSFVSGLRKSNPEYAAVAYPEQVNLANLPLKAGETLIEFKVTDDATFVWMLRNGASGTGAQLTAFYEVEKPRQWFADRISGLRIALNRGQPEQIDWHISEQLFNELFPAQFSKVLLESERITFVPDDTLLMIPFELLSPEASKASFPLLRTPTAYYPSASALKLARAAGHTREWQEAFLGIGDPITSQNDERYDIAQAIGTSFATAKSSTPEAAHVDIDKIKSRGFRFDRLPATATEVKDVASLFQKSDQTAEVRLGLDATKDRLLETDLTRFRYLHFATHGILPVDSNIKEPSLVLSFDGADERMLLSMSEILGLRIKAETVVLSACNTGTGVISRAEGVMSLGRAFMTAGAESVTVSLWEVSDESTQVLMEEYYRNLIAGKSKAQALAAARSFLFSEDKRFTNPFYWAPFVLIGD
jgi:CHAT domain-containing protein/tetratricopeptide (TPR) repeat protein